MKRNPRSRHAPATVVLVLALTTSAGCKRKQDAVPPPAPPAAPAVQGPGFELTALTSRVGAKPGPLSFEGVGPVGSLMSAQGAIVLRRAGDDALTTAHPGTPLFPGDFLWAGEHALATVALADDTVVQLAEDTAIVVPGRGLASDPASSLAVLCGVARVSVSPRARGEGAFLASAGPVLVGAKGTVFGVAVAAGGATRVGVEHGSVEVAAPAALDKPLTLDSGEAVVIDAAGALGKPTPFKTDDWGDWRYGVEASGKLEDVSRTHANRLVTAEASLDTDYVLLQHLFTTASTLVWQAASGEKPKGMPEVKATPAERAAAIEAAYRFAGEVARLTHAAQSDAFLLEQLYARHPTELANDHAEFTWEIAGAILYGKKLELVSEVFFAPLRPAYYALTARGRARATSLGLPPSAGLRAQAKIPDASPAEIAKRLPRPVYAPPRLDSTLHGHPLWQRAPQKGWDERLTAQPVTPRQGAWYLPPPQVEPHLLVGVGLVKPAAREFFPTVAATTADEAELTFLAPPVPPLDAPVTAP